jgi:XTP/dITP diphosphohydrolase
LQEKAAQVGFEWEAPAQVWEKVKEEINELEEAVDENDRVHMEEEFGDLVFALINYARFLLIDAETALEKANQKFTKRFLSLEAEAKNQGKILGDMTLNEMDAIWNSIKKPKTPD